MAKDFENLAETVEERRQFYDRISIETVAIETDNHWINIHTDIHFLPEDAKDYSPNLPESDYEGYLHNNLSVERFPEIVGEIINGGLDERDKNVSYVGLTTDQASDSYWMDNIYNGSSHPRYDDLRNVYSAQIQATENPHTDNRSAIERGLRRLPNPYQNLDDLVKTHLSHSFIKWNRPQIQIFAPLYIREPQVNINKRRKITIQVETHKSIKEMDCSLWIVNDRSIADRRRRLNIQTENIGDEFVKYETRFDIENDWDTIEYSLFPSEFDEIEGAYGQTGSIFYEIMRIVLGYETIQDLSNEFDKYLNDRDKRNYNYNVEGFDSYVTTLFNLGGFSAISPEWFKKGAQKGSLPDCIAYHRETGQLIVVECTTSEKSGQIENKISDAYDSMERIEKNLDSDFQYPISVIPVCAFIEPDISIDYEGDDVTLLRNSDIKEFRELVENGTQPGNILSNLDINRATKVRV
jgi:hypothetical protein